MPISRIRNFSIVAHIDHGKTTLSDRLLALAGTTEPEKDKTGETSSLDALPVERARGITVKAHTTSLMVRFRGEEYLLNLIDTPGHVDFTYEWLSQVDAGAILLIDSSQGIQAQTVSNFYLAFDANLEIIPILSKVDLAVSDVEKCLEDVQKAFEMDPAKVLKISAKTGLNLDKVLPAVIDRVPPPKGSADAPFKAMLFDNWFEAYLGVICLVRVIDGVISTGRSVTSASTKQTYNVMDVGVLFPNRVSTGALYPGQVGYLVLGMRSAKEARVGDTFYEAGKPVEPLPGFKAAKPMVYAGIYPAEGQPFEVFRDAMEKLTLNDASVVLTKETSTALGIGYRCGFLGLLHMDVFLQRLEEEYDVTTVPAAPTVPYRVYLTDGTMITVDNPANYPELSRVAKTEEIWVAATILCPPEHMPNILKLCLDSRGEQKDMNYMDDKRVQMKWEIPLAEIISDFFDILKEVSSGFATLEYEEIGFRPTEVVKLSILLNGELVDPLSAIVHKSRAQSVGRDLVEKLKAVIPKHMFIIAIQAAVGKHVIARETVAALRKDVTAKCYGGDITRKMKLLNKQKEGKKKMRQIGKVELPGDAFMAVLKKKGSGD